MTGIELLKGLNTLIQDEDLNDEKLQEASEGLLPAFADYLNGCENHADGVTLIMKERFEQIEKHGRTINDDVLLNTDFQLTDAAIGLLSADGCCAYISEYQDLKPLNWDAKHWNYMMNKPYKERLIIAGALIAAELDRLKAIETNGKNN